MENTPVFDLTWLDLLASLVLPMVVALVTSRIAHPGLKAVVLAALSAVTAIVQALISAGGAVGAVDWSGSLADAVGIFLVAVALHFGLLAPLKVTGSDGAIQAAVPPGIGGRHARTGFNEPGASGLV